MTDLAGKVIWITGASGGIGESLALGASRRGAKLILTARREAELERVRQATGRPADAAVLPLDLTRFDAADASARAAGFFGPVDVLVNNAGWSQRSLTLDTQMDTYRQLMELDFFAPVALTRAVLPSMVARKSGHVLMVGSVVSKFGAPLRSGYAAAKHALAGFTEAARAEVWRDGVRFTLVCPGFVRTQVSVNALRGDGSAHGHMDKGQAKGMEAGVCAEKIWKAVEGDVEECFIGAEARFIALKRFFPGLFSYVLKRAEAT